MTGEREERLLRLEDELRAALAENEKLKEQAEDVLIVGRLAETIAGHDDETAMIAGFLDQLSVLKNLAYCGVFDVEGDGVSARLGRGRFGGDGAPARLRVSPEILAALTKGSSLPPNGWSLHARSLMFEVGRFQARSLFAVPFLIPGRIPALLVVADDRRTPDQMAGFIPLLGQMIRMARGRIESRERLAEMSRVRGDLDRKLQHRSGEYEAASRRLESEIAERRKAQEFLRLSAIVVEHTSDGVVITDAEERIVAVNRAFTEVTGYTSEEVAGKTPRVLASGRHDKAFWEAVWASVREKGRWQGEVWNRRMGGEVFPVFLNIGAVRRAGGGVTNYFGVFSDLSEVREIEARFERLALHDALTLLPNRSHLRSRVEDALARELPGGKGLALVVVDLDGFKRVNESLGQPAGDEVLRGVALRLVRSLRAGDTAARLEGDEFALLLSGVTGAEEAAAAVRKALDAVAEPFKVGGQEVFLTASAGIAVRPGDGDDFDTLLKNAGVALHRAKTSGRNGWQLYTAELTRKAWDRFVIESELRTAIQRKELFLQYQPQVSLKTGKVVGVEALTRWQHPKRGLLHPDEFMPVAEETGLVMKLGLWALRASCVQARIWEVQGLPPFTVAVNLSPQEISRKELVESVASILEATQVDGGRLELEITEGFLMESPEEALSILVELKALGLTVAIDDFGTGYSSLSHLKLFPIDKLKIDKSFVRDIAMNPDDEAIVRSIVTLGRGLNIRVVAEGVETEDQAEFLKARGCSEAQGFLFSPALDADDLARYVRERL